MARFEDFDRHEHRVITEALEWATSEFYDPGHTKEDRDTLHALIEEAKSTEPYEPVPNQGPFVWTAGLKMGEGEIKIAGQDGKDRDIKDTTGGPDRGGHPIIRKPGGRTERSAAEKPTRKVTDRPQLQPGEHAGFLYIECAHCGHIHAFCAKQPIRTYRCEECGERTPLIDMYPLRVTCECGARFNYKTNIVAQQMDVTCYHCGAPVAVEWSDKWMKFQPITNQGKGRGKKGSRK